MLLAFDLDGTIVTAEGVLPEPLRRALLAASKRHFVTVLTGRNFVSARPFLQALELKLPHATCQGARVSSADQSVLEEFFLEPEAVSHLLERYAHDPETEIYVSTDEAVYGRDPSRPRWDRAKAEGQNVLEVSEYAGQGAHKVLLFGEHIAQARGELMGRFPQLNFYGWAGLALEVVSSGGRKGRALASIASRLGVPQSEVVAFGDGENDISMLEWAGLAVGVGSLQEGVVNVIDQHVSGPEHLGILEWLERNL